MTNESLYPKYIFKTKFARRIPDPNFPNSSKHIFTLKAKNLPSGISNDANARSQNLRKSVYKEVASSLLNEQQGSPDWMFHAKNKGIVILADKVEENGNGEYIVTIKNGADQGIVDGGHTYKLIQDLKDEIPENENEDKAQYVTVEVRTGIEPEWCSEIARGLNTTVQVDESSLLGLKGEFEWMKKAIQDQPYDDKVGWEENDDKPINVKDIIALLTLFNIDRFPKDSDFFPIQGYSGKQQCVKWFKDSTKSYKNLEPILNDILYLHDLISREAYGIIGRNSTRPGSFGIMKNNEKKPKELVFLNEKVDGYTLSPCGVIPILGAFRWYIEMDEFSGLKHWKVPFDEIVEKFNGELGEGLLSMSIEAHKANKYKEDITGKDKRFWRELFQAVRVEALLNNTET